MGLDSRAGREPGMDGWTWVMGRSDGSVVVEGAIGMECAGNIERVGEGLGGEGTHVYFET